jgi:hypothetical protein
MKSGFPFAALALLITAFACLMVCADADRMRQQYAWMSQNQWITTAMFAGACMFGGLIGFVAMFFTKASWRVRMVAPIAGMLAAQVGLLILMAPGPIWRTIFAMLVLIGTSVLFRLGAE